MCQPSLLPCCQDLFRATRSVALAIFAATLLATPSTADSTAPWPQFLGPDRNGISAETGLIDKMPDDGLKELWRVPGGVGMSAVAVADGRAITLIQADGKQSVLALDAATGEKLWNTAVAQEYRNSMGHGPRGTPLIEGAMVYVFTGDGVLAALSVADGKIAWQHDTVKQLGGKVAPYGMACSPLSAGDLIVVTVGAPGATVAAYKKQSGELAWKTGDDTAGYSSPTLLEVAGRRQIVAFTGKAAVGLEPKSGQQLWRYPFKTDYDCNIATPIALRQDQIFLSAGENHGCVMLKLKPAGDGFELQERWSSLGPKSVLRTEWQTVAHVGDYLYGMDNVGASGPVTHLTCVEAATGKRMWSQQRFGKGNYIFADGKLFCTISTGELIVVRATPEQYVEIGRQKVLESLRQAPSLAGGLLYLRDDGEIVCLDARAKSYQ